jgi:hypothetical protein
MDPRAEGSRSLWKTEAGRRQSVGTQTLSEAGVSTGEDNIVESFNIGRLFGEDQARLGVVEGVVARGTAKAS